jgi:hypothetical protein
MSQLGDLDVLRRRCEKSKDLNGDPIFAVHGICAVFHAHGLADAVALLLRLSRSSPHLV